MSLFIKLPFHKALWRTNKLSKFYNKKPPFKQFKMLFVYFVYCHQKCEREGEKGRVKSERGREGKKKCRYRNGQFLFVKSEETNSITQSKIFKSCIWSSFLDVMAATVSNVDCRKIISCWQISNSLVFSSILSCGPFNKAKACCNVIIRVFDVWLISSRGVY